MEHVDVRAAHAAGQDPHPGGAGPQVVRRPLLQAHGARLDLDEADLGHAVAGRRGRLLTRGYRSHGCPGTTM